MEHVMKGNINKEKNQVKENSNGQMEVNIEEISTIIIYMEKEHIYGMIEENM